jgi:ribosomal protein S18 acetylase RimI-like enzyme
MCAAAARATIARWDPAAKKEVLALATKAWPDAERAAYQQTLHGLLQSGEANQIVLLAAREDSPCEDTRFIAAQLAQSLPGRAAIVWPPQFADAIESAQREISTRLFDRLATELATAGAHLAQALVPIGDKEVAERFAAGGFTHAADLLYLAANLDNLRDEPTTPPFAIESFNIGDERRLAALIDRTYTGTLDCPQLDGLRQTADVIAGYQAVGEFRPELWLIARDRAEDVGCLFMNLHPDVRHAEIVYVALIPEVRGRGWGAEFIKKSVELARRAGAERIVLAVDAANQPAIRIYERLGFFEFDRRAVWVRSLTENRK